MNDKGFLDNRYLLYTTLLGQKLLIKVDSKTKIKYEDKLQAYIDLDSLYFFKKENSKRI